VVKKTGSLGELLALFGLFLWSTRRYAAQRMDRPD